MLYNRICRAGLPHEGQRGRDRPQLGELLITAPAALQLLDPLADWCSLTNESRDS